MKDDRPRQWNSTLKAPRKQMARGKPIARAGKIKAKPRTASEYKRIYGSRARVAWVKALPCVGCGRVPTKEHPSENHHITTGGMGKKAHHSLIIPLCASCHDFWHDHGRFTFAETFRMTPAVEAERIARAWLDLRGEG